MDCGLIAFNAAVAVSSRTWGVGASGSCGVVCCWAYLSAGKLFGPWEKACSRLADFSTLRITGSQHLRHVFVISAIDIDVGLFKLEFSS